MIILYLALFCFLFTLIVRLSVIGGAVNALYFYPKNYQESAFLRGIAEPDVIAKKRKQFMIPFIVVMFATLLIVGLLIKPENFLQAYLYSLLFLEVLNWYDGIVIDRLWVGHSKFWVIPGMEDIPYVQTWRDVLKKRGILTLIWIIAALIPTGIISVIGSL